ncbi:arginine--tRNA ligase [Thioalkalivibrio paradoxus]|uniref:Arginine--tRNA ligase n=1 Tax=Thioalkalivibrio paradoxus ARh 1 TaxID=713585 RepID=W0DF38_9GAMM|nr:arginine--tRNA ligase [Thioalkalivibrio paradoxus]AHE97234.1 arginyl-tRNA synthetase [Thioalkalivibrio paradoxus ARh 1]
MKQTLVQALETALAQLVQEGTLPPDHGVEVQLTRAREREHGDFATNLAMQLARPARRKPREIAERIAAALPDVAGLAAVEVAGPGFINFRLADDARFAVLAAIADGGADYGRSNVGQGQRVQVEFVSANPTGPLHVGHGRGAAYGATVADLLAFCGFDVTREYYVNDAGRQMNILAASVWLRYLQKRGVELPFPANGYRGEYVNAIADDLAVLLKDAGVHPADAVLRDLPADEPDGGDKEAYIDAVVDRARELLGPTLYRQFFDHGLNAILDDIRDDLGAFGVHYQNWFSEHSLADSGAIDAAVALLQERGALYEDNGALWFRSTEYGDDKDRVVRRENGDYTYFASDIAYHRDKFERGFDRIINVWGADHHGYVARVRAALRALGLDDARLDVLLVQFAILYRGTERVQMSTRSGSFVTLRELRDEVGSDAARYFYVQRRCEQHLDFDLELAKTQSNDNPMYYIQYAHARIASVQRQAAERGLSAAAANGPEVSRLTLDPETDLLTRLDRFPELVATAALAHEPHQLAQYLRDLAAGFHAYYNAVPFMNAEDPELIGARLALIGGIRQVLANGLGLLGVRAPESM